MSDTEEVSTSTVQTSPDNNQELLLSHRYYEEVYPTVISYFSLPNFKGRKLRYSKGSRTY